jgi:protein TonB
MQAEPASRAVAAQLPASRADYGWLQRALFRRLEELKRFSRPSLENATQLKVLVKAVVSNTGELMEAEVVTSSGLERIDQEAMTLVHRAFPMPLDRSLDRPQIVMRIPITYSRD